MPLAAKVILQERTQEIKKLALEGKTPLAIAAATRLELPTVMYRLRVLRKLKQIPYVRPPKIRAQGGNGQVRVDGILAASVEEVRIVTCPSCKAKIQVLG